MIKGPRGRSGSKESRDFVHPPRDRHSCSTLPLRNGSCACGHLTGGKERTVLPISAMEKRRPREGSDLPEVTGASPAGSGPSVPPCAATGRGPSSLSYRSYRNTTMLSTAPGARRSKKILRKKEQLDDSLKFSRCLKNCPFSETSPVPTMSPKSQIKLFLIFSEASCQSRMLIFSER